MNASETHEAVRLALEILAKRRSGELTDEQARTLLDALGHSFGPTFVARLLGGAA